MAEKQMSMLSAAKATLIGGAVFLIPAFPVIFVLAKVFRALKSLAAAIGPTFRIESAIGGLVLDFLVVAVIVLVCFLAGLLAQRATARRFRTKLDQTLLRSFPLCVRKGLAENIHQSEEMSGLSYRFSLRSMSTFRWRLKPTAPCRGL